MKKQERSKLLKCARQVAKDLSLAPADVPIEGYYAEDRRLKAYFRLIRALQSESEGRASEIRHNKAYRRLKEVSESPIFGDPGENRCLLKQGQDALYKALYVTGAELTVDAITLAAYESASVSNEYSLVALGALARDSVILAALRESVVLYAEVPWTGKGPPAEPQYEWRVDPVVEERAQRFVDEFNRLFGESLPRPCRQNAIFFGEAYDSSGIRGRCVRIAIDDSTMPVRHYHWAIDYDEAGNLGVFDFWDTVVWTTKRYCERRANR